MIFCNFFTIYIFKYLDIQTFGYLLLYLFLCIGTESNTGTLCTIYIYIPIDVFRYLDIHQYFVYIANSL